VPRFEKELPPSEQERLIVLYCNKGWSLRKIGAAVGMSANGVHQVLQRLSRPRGYDPQGWDEDYD